MNLRVLRVLRSHLICERWYDWREAPLACARAPAHSYARAPALLFLRVSARERQRQRLPIPPECSAVPPKNDRGFSNEPYCFRVRYHFRLGNGGAESRTFRQWLKWSATTNGHEETRIRFKKDERRNKAALQSIRVHSCPFVVPSKLSHHLPIRFLAILSGGIP